jgi:hypothetical protein
VIVDEALGGAAAQDDRDLVLQLGAGHQEAVLGRALDRVAQRADTPRDDRDLVDRVAARQREGHQGVAHLVVGHDLALLRVEEAVALLQSGDDALDRVGEVGERDLLGPPAGGEEGASLTRFARSAPEKPVVMAATWASSVSGPSWTFFAWTSRIWRRPPCRPVDQDLAVEAAGAQQGGIEDLRAVGGAEQDHARPRRRSRRAR